jgi:hypothetical protein
MVNNQKLSTSKFKFIDKPSVNGQREIIKFNLGLIFYLGLIMHLLFDLATCPKFGI